VAQMMFGFAPGSSGSNQTLYRIFRAFSAYSFFFRKEKSWLRLHYARKTIELKVQNPTDLIFWGIFLASAFQK
jgi:hypothetical protein